MSVEGAIGTKQKVDASYLSNQVKLSERVQDATKLYKTPLIVTEEFYRGLSDHMKANCRHLGEESRRLLHRRYCLVVLYCPPLPSFFCFWTFLPTFGLFSQLLH